MLKTKAQDMFRYKGVMAVKGMDTKFVFQGGVFMGFWNSSLEDLDGLLGYHAISIDWESPNLMLWNIII